MTRDRIVARMMARAVMFVLFIGAGISLMLALIGPSSIRCRCASDPVVSLIVLLAGSFVVARVKASEV
ncbi:MAG: hypothetical protein HND48_14455 [Chloroflexi bacterium]|nr:hypothetical protein [Chloroflexota bacterium]